MVTRIMVMLNPMPQIRWLNADETQETWPYLADELQINSAIWVFRTMNLFFFCEPLCVVVLIYPFQGAFRLQNLSNVCC